MDQPIAFQLDFHKETFIFVYILIFIIAFFAYKIKKQHKYSLSFILLFALYIQFLIKFAILPIMILFEAGIGSMYDIDEPYTQMIPFHFVSEYQQGFLGLKQIVGNIGLLFPMALFVRTILESRQNKNRILKTILVCISISILIEVLQLIINFVTNYPNRVMDIDDVLLNAVGILLGVLCFELVKKCKRIYQRILSFFILAEK
ncbi:VanZ family protein [bacterium 210820-DFI.6.37]|nr:VanZ family protein [bacterium 210820-DFI.6.37]